MKIISPLLGHLALVCAFTSACGCTRVPDDVSVSTFNYTDRPIWVYIDGADAGYAAVGEGGGSACCHPWPNAKEISVRWGYGGIAGEKAVKYPPQSKKVKLPPLPECWRKGMVVYLVAHIYPNHEVQLETLVERAPWPKDVSRSISFNEGKCEVSVLGERQ